MRIIIVIALLTVSFMGCKKDKFDTVPQIKYKSISPNVFPRSNVNSKEGPVLTINVKDAEGDFGFKTGTDTSYVYVKNITIAPFRIDSLKFPDLANAKRSNLDADVNVLIRSVLASSNRPNRPFTDTLYFEVYVKDFAKNKSNVITAGPVFYISD
ncbi:MAG TPA: hypothetical protein VK498_08925 [Ferruginibacter sp.]|nr:hypothetical protein [Ferruginibacter sp.]